MTCRDCEREAVTARVADCCAPLAEAARAYLGVPFLHQGRNPAIGIDCIGLLVLACAGAGVPVAQHDARYGRDPHDGLLEQHLRAAFGEPVADMRPGDVVAIAELGAVRHVGILGARDGALTLIHTSAAPSVRRVVETPLNDKYRRRIKRVYRSAV